MPTKPRKSRLLGFAEAAPLWLLFAAAAAGVSCTESQSDLGSVCVVLPDFSGATIFSVDDDSEDCASRLCLKQEGYRCRDGLESCPDEADRQKVMTYCSRSCETSDDCRGGGSDVNQCSRYVCAKSSAAGVGPDCSCVCLDFIRGEDGLPINRESFDSSSIACSP